ncbi:seipin [Anaeramoeba flamelloides]|nr:seipin [Anaeramoeba flamelloides]
MFLISKTTPVFLNFLFKKIQELIIYFSLSQRLKKFEKIWKKISVYGIKYLKISSFVLGHLFLLLIIASIVLLFSTITYSIFYYFYIPESAIEQEIYFDYALPEKNTPYAEIDLLYNPLIKTKYLNHRTLRPNQGYRATLELELPDSPTNRNAGVWMIQADTYSNSIHTDTTRQPAILVYRSNLIRSLRSLLFSFPLVSGLMREKQKISIELFENYIEQQDHPTSRIEFILSNPKIELYSSKLIIRTNYTGLKYICYYWFYTSLIIGILCIFLVQYSIALIIYINVWILIKKYRKKMNGNGTSKNRKQNKIKLSNNVSSKNMEKEKEKEKVSSVEHEIIKAYEPKPEDFEEFNGNKINISLMEIPYNIEIQASLEINKNKLVIRAKPKNYLLNGLLGISIIRDKINRKIIHLKFINTKIKIKFKEEEDLDKFLQIIKLFPKKEAHLYSIEN